MNIDIRLILIELILVDFEMLLVFKKECWGAVEF